MLRLQVVDLTLDPGWIAGGETVVSLGLDCCFAFWEEGRSAIGSRGDARREGGKGKMNSYLFSKPFACRLFAEQQQDSELYLCPLPC